MYLRKLYKSAIVSKIFVANSINILVPTESMAGVLFIFNYITIDWLNNDG